MIQGGYSADPHFGRWFCGLAGELGYPFSTPVPQEWCPEAPMYRGTGFCQPYPTLSIIHASVLSPPPGRLPSSRNKVFLQFTFLVNVYLLAQGPLSSRLPHLGSMLQAALWDMEGKLLNFFPAQLGLPVAPPELKIWAPWQSSPLIPTLGPAEPRTEAPSGSTSVPLLISSPWRGLKRRS